MRGVLVIIVATAMASDGWDTLWWLPSDGEVTPGKQVASHKTMPHLMFIPAGTPPTDGWPLLVFLHGQGESSGAAPLANVALQGPPQHAGRHPESLPFAVLSPQKPLSSQFFDHQISQQIMSLVDEYIGSMSLDRHRVYLTGLSQGGIGTWGLASNEAYAQRFAAIAPVCGGIVQGHAPKRATVLADTPVWAFHGANDAILPVALSDDAVGALRASERTAFAGAPKYTRLDSARGSDYSWAAAGVPHMEGHASWVEAYYPAGTKVGVLPPLYEWLLRHSRSDLGPAQGAGGSRKGKGSGGTAAADSEL